MSDPTSAAAGRVVALWRYPVKSMMGEELNASEVGALGLLGDRAYALVDAETGKVVSAKNPRKWPNLFEFRAAYAAPPEAGGALPPARITLPGGTQVATDRADADRLLSEAVGRPVRLAAAGLERPRIEGYWPDEDWLPARDTVFEVELPAGTFFDEAVVHLVTTATLDRLRALAPGSRFETRRFRPNLVVAPPEGGASGFVEDDWAGRTLAIGAEVRLHVTRPCPRCVMTTLGQGDLPRDPAVLRAVVEHHDGNVGVLASVVRGGRVRRGDPVTLA